MYSLYKLGNCPPELLQSSDLLCNLNFWPNTGTANRKTARANLQCCGPGLKTGDGLVQQQQQQQQQRQQQQLPQLLPQLPMLR
mmetsp:Transcript_72290/g.143364  ORF Transcript_72290/g.143364 Transcript_72290/m.143364 type:complete len:83 (-) Transcript_72290:71-319(-)